MPIVSMAVPEIVATGASPDKAVVLAPVCSDNCCKAAVASIVRSMKSRNAPTEAAPTATAKAVLATVATCWSELFMSLA